MTKFERAELRLKAWQAIEGWGTLTIDPEAKNELDKKISTPWNWKDRMERAHELFEWMAEAAED